MKLIAKLKKRCEPITKTDGEGKVWLVGYKRKSNSRHAGQEYFYKEPKLLSEETNAQHKAKLESRTDYDPERDEALSEEVNNILAHKPARPISRNSPCPCGSGKRTKACHPAFINVQKEKQQS